MAVVLALGDRAALHGTSLLPVPVPCSPCSIATGASCTAGHCPRTAGCQHRPSGARAEHRELHGGTSLELLLPALTHTFIRISEACNKRIGRHRKQQRQRQQLAAGRREMRGVWVYEAGQGCTGAAHLPGYMLPASHMDTQERSSSCRQAWRKERQSYQRSAINI